jgi:uncharacterized protein YdaU (DUF1376 family)
MIRVERSSAFAADGTSRTLSRMLTQAWRRGARLPNDPEAIRRATGCTAKEWKRCWPQIAKYWRVDGDWLVNDTQLEVYREATARLDRKSAAGKRANEIRWSNRSDIGPDVRAESSPSPSLSPSQSPVPSLPERSQGEKAHGATHPAPRTGGGVMAGDLPRDHLRHAWCSPRICVPDFIHRQLVGAKGGDPTVAETWLRGQWYPAVVARQTGPIGSPPQKCWPAAFDAEFPPPRTTRSTGWQSLGRCRPRNGGEYQISIRGEEA